MPECHGKHSGHAEDQREGQEVPLFPEEIDVCVSKKFHAAVDPFKISRWLLVVGRSQSVALFSFPNDSRPTTNDSLKCSMPLHPACGSAPNQHSPPIQTL